MSVFKLQIVFPDGRRPAIFAAGGGEEADLIAAVTAAVVAKDVGLFRSKEVVARAVADGMREVFAAVKLQARKAL